MGSSSARSRQNAPIEAERSDLDRCPDPSKRIGPKKVKRETIKEMPNDTHRCDIRTHRCDIRIFSRQAIEALAEPKEPYAVISITNTEADKANLRHLRNTRGVLRIAFDEDDFRPAHARRIWEFIRTFDGEVQTYLVHCMASRVRSASIAAGLALLRGRGMDEVEEIFAHYDPTEGIYQVMRDTYSVVFTPHADAADWKS